MAKRPWSPYKVIPIRLKGTNKTEIVDHSGKEQGRKIVEWGNLLDPVRGCPGFADPAHPQCSWDCYSEEAVRRQKKIFGQPVSMELKEHLLRKDLKNLMSDWVRIGVDGAPSWNWELTTRCAEIVADEGKIPLIVTRYWRSPKIFEAHRLQRIGTVINATISAADPMSRIERIMTDVRGMIDLGGLVALRVVTFAFKKDDPRWKVQNMLMSLDSDMFSQDRETIPVLEQPARVIRWKNPNRETFAWQWVDRQRYHDYHSYITGEPLSKWQTAGQLYPGYACVTSCPMCENQCMVRVLTNRGDVLGRPIEAEVAA